VGTAIALLSNSASASSAADVYGHREPLEPEISAPEPLGEQLAEVAGGERGGILLAPGEARTELRRAPRSVPALVEQAIGGEQTQRGVERWQRRVAARKQAVVLERLGAPRHLDRERRLAADPRRPEQRRHEAQRQHVLDLTPQVRSGAEGLRGGACADVGAGLRAGGQDVAVGARLAARARPACVRQRDPCRCCEERPGWGPSHRFRASQLHM
jgi:hypothetical protein